MPEQNTQYHLTEMEIDTIGEVGNISMSSAATVMHDILQRKVTITTPMVSVTNMKELADKYNVPYVLVDVSYTEGITGTNILIIKTDDVKLITSIMLGEETPNYEEPLGELEISAIGEVMNQMMGTSATSMSTLINKPINISPPQVSIVNISEDRDRLNFEHEDQVISVKFKLEIENTLETEIVLLMPYAFGKQLVQSFLTPQSRETAEIAEQAPPQPSATINIPPEHVSAPTESVKKQKEHANVKAATFQSFDNNSIQNKDTDNIDLLMDVPLMLSVELARTKRHLKDILELNIGSIVSLDKPAGELVEVLVNGKLIARGEVVVIDDNFGVRITDIVGPDKRVKGTA